MYTPNPSHRAGGSTYHVNPNNSTSVGPMTKFGIEMPSIAIAIEM